MASVKPHTGLKGTDIVLANLNREIMKIKARSNTGLIQAAIFIRRDMEKTPPLIPLDTGNLRTSWFTTAYKNVKKLGLIIGFSANYAVFVHEMVDKSSKKINWSRPGSGPKFFEAALKRNTKQILKIIGINAHIKR